MIGIETRTDNVASNRTIESVLDSTRAIFFCSEINKSIRGQKGSLQSDRHFCGRFND